MVGRNKKPVGQSIRDMINPALQDMRKPQIQLDLLNEFFEALTIQFPRMLEDAYQDVFNQAAAYHKKDPNPFIIHELTEINPMTREAKYPAGLRLQIPLALKFTEFQATDIKKLPAYVLFHEVARAEDVAVKITGLTSDEHKSTGMDLPAYLSIDASKTYNQGAMENSMMYPDLPEVPADFERDAPKQFKFGK